MHFIRVRSPGLSSLLAVDPMLALSLGLDFIKHALRLELPNEVFAGPQVLAIKKKNQGNSWSATYLLRQIALWSGFWTYTKKLKRRLSIWHVSDWISVLSEPSSNPCRARNSLRFFFLCFLVHCFYLSMNASRSRSKVLPRCHKEERSVFQRVSRNGTLIKGDLCGHTRDVRNAVLISSEIVASPRGGIIRKISKRSNVGCRNNAKFQMNHSLYWKSVVTSQKNIIYSWTRG